MTKLEIIAQLVRCMQSAGEWLPVAEIARMIRALAG